MDDLTVEDYRHIIDTYMPTIITGVDQVSRKAHQKPREQWDVDDVAIMAAYSYAHHMLYHLTGRQDADPMQGDYDLPSVIDLMETLKKRNAAIDLACEEFPEVRAVLGRYEGRMYGG